MKVLRTTLYTPGGGQLMAVVREQDVTSFSEVLAGRPEDAFLTHEVFDVPDDFSFEDCVAEAGRRWTPEIALRERNMSVSFFWNADKLGIVNPGGVLANPGRAPYNADACRQVLIQLKAHPNYHGQTVVTHAADGTIVSLLRDGAITEEYP